MENRIVKDRYNYRKLLGRTKGMMENDWYFEDTLIEYKTGYQVWRVAHNRDLDVVIDDDVSDEYGGKI